MTYKNSTNIFATTGLLLLFLLLSCAKNEVEVTKEAQVKVVNVIESSDPQDFYFNDKKIFNSPFNYSIFSEYFTVVAEIPHKIVFKPIEYVSGKASGTWSFENGKKYILFACSNAPRANPAASTSAGPGYIFLIQNDLIAPPAGKIKVRFLNLAEPLLSTLNVETSGSTSLVNNLAYYGISKYHAIDANLGLKFNITGSSNFISIPNSAFQTGKNYTVWFDASNPSTPNYHIVTEN